MTLQNKASTGVQASIPFTTRLGHAHLTVANLDRQITFYQKVRPFGPGWRTIREAAEIPDEGPRSAGENIPLGLLGWVAGCTVIWSSLFAVGNFLYGRQALALALLGVFIVSGLVLLRVINRLWTDRPVQAGG